MLQDHADLKSRIELLEERNAFQDQMIDDLNTTITEQWKAIDKLKRDMDRLISELGEIEQNLGTPTPRDPPPPHY